MDLKLDDEGFFTTSKLIIITFGSLIILLFGKLKLFLIF